jgi:hypothetical protein
MKQKLKDLFERVLKTAAQTAVATIGVSSTLGALNWAVIGSTVGLASVVTALKWLLGLAKADGAKPAASYYKDLLGRAGATAAETALGAIGAATMLGQVDWKAALSTVAVATVLSVLSSVGSRGFGSEGTASLVDGGDGGGE